MAVMTGSKFGLKAEGEMKNHANRTESARVSAILKAAQAGDYASLTLPSEYGQRQGVQYFDLSEGMAVQLIKKHGPDFISAVPERILEMLAAANNSGSDCLEPSGGAGDIFHGSIGGHLEC